MLELMFIYVFDGGGTNGHRIEAERNKNPTKNQNNLSTRISNGHFVIRGISRPIAM
jgi:hypothetical protein